LFRLAVEIRGQLSKAAELSAAYSPFTPTIRGKKRRYLRHLPDPLQYSGNFRIYFYHFGVQSSVLAGYTRNKVIFFLYHPEPSHLLRNKRNNFRYTAYSPDVSKNDAWRTGTFYHFSSTLSGCANSRLPYTM
jgi:hypothetical protein